MKRAIIITCLLILFAVAALSFLFYVQFHKEKEKIRTLRMGIDEMSAERESIYKKIKDIKDEKEKIDAQLQEYSMKAQQLNKDISEVKRKEEDLSKQFSMKEEVFLVLKDRLSSIMQKESGLKAELERTKSDYLVMAKKIESTRRTKKVLEEEIKDYITPPKGVELKKIVVKVTPPVEGEIIELNKEYSFAIIDMGLRDDIKSGNLLAIYRNGNFMARAVVENVYEGMSSIIVFDEWADVPLSSGDNVRLLKS